MNGDLGNVKSGLLNLFTENPIERTILNIDVSIFKYIAHVLVFQFVVTSREPDTITSCNYLNVRDFLSINVVSYVWLILH